MSRLAPYEVAIEAAEKIRDADRVDPLSLSEMADIINRAIVRHEKPLRDVLEKIHQAIDSADRVDFWWIDYSTMEEIDDILAQTETDVRT